MAMVDTTYEDIRHWVPLRWSRNGGQGCAALLCV